MGIISFFSSENRKARRVEKNIKRANNKHTPKDYRQAALYDVIHEAKAGYDMAIIGLLKRFSVNAEPSIEDEKEKDWVCDALIEIGETARPKIVHALRTAESVNWLHRVLRHIVSPEEYKRELLCVLSEFDTEYERNPDRKLQTIMALADTCDEEIAEQMLRFLDDVDETVRFQTVEALASFGHDLSREQLLSSFLKEESIRVKNRILEAFVALEWPATGAKKLMSGALPDGFRMEKSGRIVKSNRG